MVSLAERPEADRHARLGALADARGLPLTERVKLAARLLDRVGG